MIFTNQQSLDLSGPRFETNYAFPGLDHHANLTMLHIHGRLHQRFEHNAIN